MTDKAERLIDGIACLDAIESRLRNLLDRVDGVNEERATPKTEGGDKSLSNLLNNGPTWVAASVHSMGHVITEIESCLFSIETDENKEG